MRAVADLRGPVARFAVFLAVFLARDPAALPFFERVADLAAVVAPAPAAVTFFAFFAGDRLTFLEDAFAFVLFGLLAFFAFGLAFPAIVTSWAVPGVRRAPAMRSRAACARTGLEWRERAGGAHAPGPAAAAAFTNGTALGRCPLRDVSRLTARSERCPTGCTENTITVGFPHASPPTSPRPSGRTRAKIVGAARPRHMAPDAESLASQPVRRIFPGHAARRAGNRAARAWG